MPKRFTFQLDTAFITTATNPLGILYLGSGATPVYGFTAINRAAYPIYMKIANVVPGSEVIGTTDLLISEGAIGLIEEIPASGPYPRVFPYSAKPLVFPIGAVAWFTKTEAWDDDGDVGGAGVSRIDADVLTIGFDLDGDNLPTQWVAP